MNPDTTVLETLPSLAEIAESFSAPTHAHATEWTVSVLKKAMNDGSLIPGTQLSELKISTDLGISRNTLRQAFTVLAAHNLVEHIPNRGVFVVTPDRQQIQELMTLRLAVESTALLRSAPGEKPQIRAVIARAYTAKERGSVSGMAMANQEFHRLLVALAGSNRLDTIMSAILAEMRLIFFSMITVPEFHAEYVDLNARLLDLIEAGERRAACVELEDYLRTTETYLLENLA